VTKRLALYKSISAFTNAAVDKTSLWTLDLAAEEAHQQGLTAARVTGETVRATLVRLGVRWLRAKTWITSPDPAYARKKARLANAPCGW